MKNLLFAIILVGLMFFFQSCGTMVYTSSSYGNLKSYTAKQEYREKDTAAYYSSIQISKGVQKRESFDNDNKFLVRIKAHRAITKKHFNFYYGIGAGYGTHRFKLKNINRQYSLLNFEAKTGFNFNIPRPKTDWRIFGIEMGYTYEFGPYQNKLKEIKEEDLSALVFNKKSIWHYNLYSEAVFKLHDNKTLSIELFFGDILNKSGTLKDYSSDFFGYVLSYKFNRYSISLIEEIGNEGITSTKIGLTYQFH